MSKKKRTFIYKFFKITIAGLLLFFLGFYIFQLNDVVEKSYLINNSQKELNHLLEENSLLKLNSFQNGHFRNLEEFASRLNFEKVGTIKYIQVSRDSLVARE